MEHWEVLAHSGLEWQLQKWHPFLSRDPLSGLREWGWTPRAVLEVECFGPRPRGPRPRGLEGAGAEGRETS